MNVYVDSSVLVRIVFGEPGPLSTWPRIGGAISSELTRVECLRTIDRTAILGRLEDDVVSQRRAHALDLIDGMHLLRVSGPILERAAEPFPTALGTLDAIHLATALAARGQFAGLSVATHDRELATAARAVGFAVDGIG